MFIKFERNNVTYEYLWYFVAGKGLMNSFPTWETIVSLVTKFINCKDAPNSYNTAVLIQIMSFQKVGNFDLTNDFGKKVVVKSTSGIDIRIHTNI